MMSIGEIITERRHRQGWSQAKLCRKAGIPVNRGEISSYENDKTTPSPYKMRLLCKALRLSFAEMELRAGRIPPCHMQVISENASTVNAYLTRLKHKQKPPEKKAPSIKYIDYRS